MRESPRVVIDVVAGSSDPAQSPETTSPADADPRGDDDSRLARAERIRDEICALVEAARRIAVGPGLEEQSSAQLLETLLPSASASLDGGCAALTRLGRVFELEHLRSSGDWREERRLRAERDRATMPVCESEIVDLCAVVAMELAWKKDRLVHLTAADSPWTILEASASGLRKLVRGLTAAEAAVAAWLGEAPRLSLAVELQASLRVRMAFARMRHVILVADDRDTGLDRRLRRAAGAFAVMIGDDAYPLLRTTDRVTLRDLQRRLCETLSRPRPADDRDAEHLWRDICSFVELLANVRRREVLRQHDRHTVAALLVELAGASPQAPLDARQRARLADVAGLDYRLDDVLHRNRGARVETVLALLEHVRVTLQQEDSGAVEVPPDLLHAHLS